MYGVVYDYIPILHICMSISVCIDKCSPCRLVGWWLSNACRVVSLSDTKCNYIYIVACQAHPALRFMPMLVIDKPCF